MVPLLVKAVIEHESAGTWDPEILGDPGPCGVYTPHPFGNVPGAGRVSTRGYCAMGLMQVNRRWHSAGGYDLLRGADNILVGTQILGTALSHYPGDWRRALAEYNGGRVAAEAYPDGPSAAYVDAVGTRLFVYSEQAGIPVA